MLLDYLTEPVTDRVDYEDFLASPFRAFLHQSVHLFDAFNSCRRHFARKPVRKAEYTKDSVHSMQEIASPLLVALMSNLELLQRCVFAKLFDLSSPLFSPDVLLQRLRQADIAIDMRHVVGYRGNEAAVGNIVADALTGWHDPSKVNEYLMGLLNAGQFYPDDVAQEIRVLWQLRHSIVHTGGTLTVPDAQKVEELGPYAGRAIVFRYQAVDGIVRWFHRALNTVRDGFFPKVRARFKTGYEGHVKHDINTLFKLDSPRASWLK